MRRSIAESSDRRQSRSPSPSPPPLPSTSVTSSMTALLPVYTRPSMKVLGLLAMLTSVILIPWPAIVMLISSAPPRPQLSTETIIFDVGSADPATYPNFITSLRDKLKSSSTSYFEIPMLPPPSGPPKYIYVVLKSSEQKSITLAIAMSDIYVCGYSDSYQGKVRACFFNDAPPDAKQTLFPDAKGSLRDKNIGYDGVYSKIEQKAGKKRESVELGITILNSRINKLAGKSKTDKDFVKTEAEFFLIAIQMVSEAARFKYIKEKIEKGPYTPDPKAISLEGMWGKISEAIKGANPQTEEIPRELSDKLVLYQPDGSSWRVTNVSQIKPDMGLLKYVAGSHSHQHI